MTKIWPAEEPEQVEEIEHAPDDELFQELFRYNSRPRPIVMHPRRVEQFREWIRRYEDMRDRTECPANGRFGVHIEDYTQTYRPGDILRNVDTGETWQPTS